MPARSFRWRAHQSVAEPESDRRIAWSGSRDDSSWKSSCGLTGSASMCAQGCRHLDLAISWLYLLLELLIQQFMPMRSATR